MKNGNNRFSFHDLIIRSIPYQGTHHQTTPHLQTNKKTKIRASSQLPTR